MGAVEELVKKRVVDHSAQQVMVSTASPTATAPSSAARTGCGLASPTRSSFRVHHGPSGLGRALRDLANHSVFPSIAPHFEKECRVPGS
jgi:hypothetical protein